MDLSGKPLQKAFVRGRHVAKNLIIHPDSRRGPALGRMLSKQPPHKLRARILELKEMLLWGWRGCQGPRGLVRKFPLVGQTHKPPGGENPLPEEGREEVWEGCGRRMENPHQTLRTAQRRLGEDCRSSAKVDTQTGQPSSVKLTAQSLCLDLKNFHAAKSRSAELLSREHSY